MAARHPIERLYSAFKGKIVPRHRIIKGVNGDKTKTPRFTNFMKYVSRTKTYNIHWSPNTAICNPCHFHFDYLIHQESFGSDIMNMFKEQNVHYPKRIKPLVQKEGSSYYKDVLKDVNPDVLKAFLKRFKMDFLLFGYNITDVKNFTL